MAKDRFDEGLKLRKQVLGADYVERSMAGGEIAWDQRQELWPYCVGNSLSIRIRAKIGPTRPICPRFRAQPIGPAGSAPGQRRRRPAASRLGHHTGALRRASPHSISTLDWRSAVGVALSRVGILMKVRNG